MKENIKIILVTTLSLVLDQIIKYIITTNLKLTEMIQVIKNFFRNIFGVISIKNS